MRQLALLAVVYLLIAALVLPASPFAADDTTATPPEAPPAETAPAAPPPAPEPEQAPAAAAPQPEPATQAEQPAPAAASQEHAAERPRARAAAPGSVIIRDFSFTPRTVTVNEGESVTWRNEGREPHSATATDGSFDTGTFRGGASRSARFDKAGTFAYICTPHPFMKGTVRVRAASSGSEPSQQGSGGAGSAQAGDTGSGGSAGAAGRGGSEDSGDSGAALPNSGAEAEALAVLGVLMLGLGVAMRRRAAA